MGIDRKTHLIYGWKKDSFIGIDGEEIDTTEDSFLPYIEGHKGIKHTIIEDQISGEYVLFGLDLGSVDEDGECIEIDISELDEDALVEKYREVFGVTPDDKPKVLLFLNAY